MNEIEKLKEELNDLTLRVSKLEAKLSMGKPAATQSTDKKERDKTKYLFNGSVYTKNKLVLAVTRQYAFDNNVKTLKELTTIFPKSLQGSKGVVNDYNLVKNIKDVEKRYFCKKEDIIKLDKDCVVCTQWGIFNIVNFIARVKQLGYNIESL